MSTAMRSRWQKALRYSVLLYLGACLGYAVWSLSPRGALPAALAVSTWVALAYALRWGHGDGRADAKRRWPWLLLPLALWWIHITLTSIFGAVDESAILFHLQVGMEGHGSGARASAIAGHVLAGLLMLASLAWLTRADPRWQRWQLPVACIALLSHPLVFEVASRSTAYLRDDASWLDRRYVEPEVEASPERPKNVVVLYLESVERTYADRSRFGDVYDDLLAVEEKGLVVEGIAQIEQTGWTMAGLVASQCGVPLMPAGLLDDEVERRGDLVISGIHCLGAVLNRLGYELVFIGGARTSFAGKGRFLRGQGFSRVLGFDELAPRLDDPGYVNSWGLFDDTLLDLAVEELRALHSETKPFALVALTLAAHPPHGEPARSCSARQGVFDGEDILYSVRCTAWLLRRFVERLEDEGLLDDTLLVIASDHLSMKNSAWQELVVGPRENTLILLGEGIAPGRVQRRASMLDVFPTILDAMGFSITSSRAGLGTSLLSEEPTLLERYGERELSRRQHHETALPRRIWLGE